MIKLVAKGLAVVLTAVCLGGCFAPTQYQGNIPVDTAGFAERTAALCRLGMTDGPVCAATADDMPTTR